MNAVSLTVTRNTEHFRGVFTSLAALQSAVPVANAGDYADVDAGIGTDVQRYIWDRSDSQWVLGGGGPFTLTNGSGTTANGTAVDLGGSLNKSTTIDAGVHNFVIKYDDGGLGIGAIEWASGTGLSLRQTDVAGSTMEIIFSTFGDLIIQSNAPGFPGLIYNGNFSGNYLDDSLPAWRDVKAYADALVVGLLDDRGNHNASGNLFPSSGGSGTAGAIKKGDLWTISVAGTLGGVAVTAGDVVRALVDTPGQTSSNWVITENNIGYVPENNANKSGTVSASSILFPNHNAVIAYAVPVTRQIAGNSLSADITAAQLRTALAIITTIPIQAVASGGGVITLTNMTNVEQIFPAGASVHLFKFDATNYATVRITTRVSANSNSANDPRLYMQYSTDNGSNWITIGLGTTASGEALSLATVTNQAFTNWVSLPSGAKADVLFRVAQNGGDANADPAVCSVYVSFRT